MLYDCGELAAEEEVCCKRREERHEEHDEPDAKYTAIALTCNSSLLNIADNDRALSANNIVRAGVYHIPKHFGTVAKR